MPKIDLKRNSPEFADDTSGLLVHCCNMPGCTEKALHKAPKNRSLEEYYYFCLEHVQEYNKAWNYFSGMSQSDIEEQMAKSYLWDRPTWKYKPGDEEELHNKARQAYNFSDDDEDKEEDRSQGHRSFSEHSGSPEVNAMNIMGLTPPIDMKILKAKYKELVKKYHPDINQNDPEAEEMLKSVNMAYTILELAYGQFEKINEKE
jgi:curved DNA-binding protein CbpA